MLILTCMGNISNTGWDLQSFLCWFFMGDFKLLCVCVCVCMCECIWVYIQISLISPVEESPCPCSNLLFFLSLCPAPPYYFRLRPSALYPSYTSSRLSFLESIYGTAHRRPHWPLEDWYRHRMSIIFPPLFYGPAYLFIFFNTLSCDGSCRNLHPSP